MIEKASEFGASAAVPLVTGDHTHMSAGDMLRHAREAHGLHLDMVAAALKVTPQKLAALESDDIEALPDPVFARALAASVCRALRIDPAPVLAKLPGAQPAGLAQADRTMSKALPSQVRASRSSSGLPSRPLLTVVGLLLVGAAVLFWLPQSIFDRVGEALSQFGGRADGSEPAASSAQAPSAPQAGGTVADPVQPMAPAGSADPGTMPAAGAVPAAQASAPSAANATDLIVFVAREDSWVTVTDAGGKSLLRRTVQAGETVGLNGTLPLSVVVGRAAVVDVQVRGKALDLKPLTRGGGVARFEVKP
ncbi:helix-turn-helix domain-containing protein [Variovorax sp. PBS-H4]|uniref:helix-turn-helix domain-containing protein n=1 Tax=Variovorax sp. PBS-H4 TaxID=434008 RepID=UPI0013A59980|nr:helix-turn-helix domain-containing protein [Variovorax sp. PBS-H4]